MVFVWGGGGGGEWGKLQKKALPYPNITISSSPLLDYYVEESSSSKAST